MSRFKTALMILTCAFAGQVSNTSSAQAVNPWPTSPGQTTMPTGNAIVQPPVTVTPNPIITPNPAPPPAAQQNPLSQILSMMGGGGPMGSAANNLYGPSSSSVTSNLPGMAQIAGSGKMEPCGNPPLQVEAAMGEAKSFREKCSLAQKGDNQKIVINDYSTDHTPYMYIYDLKGVCLGKTAVSYGNGLGPRLPQACNDKESHLTPPGFFLTGYHNTTDYPNTLVMVGLEGQQSAGRGILIHPAASPGTASSWGCSGVGPFPQVKQMLGEGSLVYNYFGNRPPAGNCGNKNGSGAHNFCRLDSNAPAMPAYATGSPSPAVR